MDREILDDIDARLLFLVHTQDWRSVTASGHLSYVCDRML